MKKLKILFLCTGNACRSQIAEGWAKQLKSDCIEAYSAGVAPGMVNKNAIAVMAEAGVDISGHISKHVDELGGIEFDYVVTLCDNARGNCPVFGGGAKLVHKGFYDPSFMPGTAEEIWAEFIKLRDEIRALVESIPEGLENLS